MSSPATQKLTPLLPIRNFVLFPYSLIPLSIGRPATAAAVNAAIQTEEKELIVVAQKNSTLEVPTPDDLFRVGTRTIIKKMVKTPSGTIELLVQGMERVRILSIDESGAFLGCTFETMELPTDRSPETEALFRTMIDTAKKILVLSQAEGLAEITQLLTSENLMRVVYMLGSALPLELEKEQQILEANSTREALEILNHLLNQELQVLELRQQIASQVQTELTKEQREHMLRREMRAIQQELGDENPELADIALLQQKLDEADLPEDPKREAQKQLDRLKKLPSMAPDYHIVRSYVEFILELPWNKSTEDSLDIARARNVLDEDHYDLKEIKERILEHLGVMKLNPNAKSPILCFVGPPGVGKTSLGQSIARSLGRKFERMSLGGMHDEAELRGHRRTYIGAMPGRIIKAVQLAGVNNPVLMLDELDKLGRDFRGDPAAALLEVLDPEQNRTFRDNYLDLTFDLSKIFFITTANTLDTIPRPLLDRMEILQLSGYTEEEKIVISERYLIPRQTSEAGLTKEKFSIEPEALRLVISRYTREAGVRQLERTIGRLARKSALIIAEKGETSPINITAQNLEEFLGPERFFQEQARTDLPPGVATGLAWTDSGGDVLYIEATLLPDGHAFTLTGQLGEVMQESARAAHSFLWSYADRYGIDQNAFKQSGLHIHVPAGAIRKDGPSAGVTIATALASAYSQNPVRSDTAMTGEITLTGLVLPVGGIKEKVLAARRAGIKRVILPKNNQKDLRELPEETLNSMEFIFAETLDDVIPAAIPQLAKKLITAGAD